MPLRFLDKLKIEIQNTVLVLVFDTDNQNEN